VSCAGITNVSIAVKIRHDFLKTKLPYFSQSHYIINKPPTANQFFAGRYEWTNKSDWLFWASWGSDDLVCFVRNIARKGGFHGVALRLYFAWF
jgi:hypothetical protein